MKTITMKANFKFLAIILSLGLFLQSCSDEEEIDLNAPIISNFEYGEGSTHTTDQIAYKGSDIHLEAEINAEAVVSSITLSIHSHDLTPGDNEVEWEFEQVFTDTNYLAINPTFHEHVDVPTNIPAGEYHVELLVIDELGNSTEVEGHIQILDLITLSEISIDATVERGSDFHSEFMIDAVNGIHSISVDIHAHGVTVGTGEVEWDFEQEFLGNYHEQTSVEFHEHIDVPTTAPAGEYHIHFTVEDEDGNTKEYETHIDVTA
jgi:5-hydroxyisourate hydrolase-like protein (transthyretin family)